MEEWKDVIGYEGLYKISSYGRFLNVKRNHILKLNKTQSGYWHITLQKYHVPKTYRVHRLVALHFIPNPNNYPVVNHKDENKLNNHADNLEWCTYQYNTRYNDAHIRSKGAKKRVAQYDKDGIFIREYESAMEVSRTYGFSHSAMTAAARDGNRLYHNYVWRYI